MSVDIIIPVHNRISLLNRSIQSVLDQSYPLWELFIIDDASDISNFLPHSFFYNERIHTIRLNRNRGPAYARNLGASLGSSNWIAFLDSDDYWHPKKLETQISFLKEHPKYNWVHTNEKWIRNSKEVKPKKIHQKKGGIFMEDNFQRCLISPSSVLFRRNFWIQNNGFNPAFRVAEDYEAWLRINFNHPIGYISSPLTIKTAGDWKQLSSTPEIDRQRVLALHRFYRLNYHKKNFLTIQKNFFSEVERKLQILINGATKYGKTQRAMQYQSWSKVFKRARTKFI